jgi:hypothetical protein
MEHGLRRKPPVSVLEIQACAVTGPEPGSEIEDGVPQEFFIVEVQDVFDLLDEILIAQFCGGLARQVKRAVQDLSGNIRDPRNNRPERVQKTRFFLLGAAKGSFIFIGRVSERRIKEAGNEG